jgi:hypothetical protein
MSDTSYDTPLFSLHRLPVGRLRCGPILLFFFLSTICKCTICNDYSRRRSFPFPRFFVHLSTTARLEVFGRLFYDLGFLLGERWKKGGVYHLVESKLFRLRIRRGVGKEGFCDLLGN